MGLNDSILTCLRTAEAEAAVVVFGQHVFPHLEKRLAAHPEVGSVLPREGPGNHRGTAVEHKPTTVKVEVIQHLQIAVVIV